MPKQKIEKPTDEMIALLKSTGSADAEVAGRAMRSLAGALSEPLRGAVLEGEIIGDVFAVEPLEPGATAEYPLDLYQPGQEGDYVAYTLPNEGALPMRNVSSDILTIQTFEIGNAIDWLLKYSRTARWNVVARAMEVMEAGFVSKLNVDGWKTIIAAGVGRGLCIYDSAATAGQFTKRLVSLMKTSMRRYGGGNSASVASQRGQLTDLYLSPEAIEDIRAWDANEIDEITRRDIFTAQDGVLSRIYGVNLHDLDELGEAQIFQNYYGNATAAGGLGASMAISDKEIVVGLDLSKNDSFVMPVKEQLQLFDDPTLHRKRRAGVYGWMECGFAALDERRVLIGSF